MIFRVKSIEERVKRNVSWVVLRQISFLFTLSSFLLKL